MNDWRNCPNGPECDSCQDAFDKWEAEQDAAFSDYIDWYQSQPIED